MGKADITLDIVIATALRAPVETIRCTIRSVVANTHYHKRIILVVNPKLDHEQSIAVIKNVTGGLNADKAINAIYLEAELGYCRPNNIGISCSGASFICLMNDDVIVPPNWDKGLIEKIIEYDAALCCPLIAGNERNISEGRHQDKTRGAHIFGQAIPFVCPIFPRRTFEEYGLLSIHPDFDIFGGDTEYCQRLICSSEKMILATDCIVEARRRTTLGPILMDAGKTESEVYKIAMHRLRKMHAEY